MAAQKVVDGHDTAENEPASACGMVTGCLVQLAPSETGAAISSTASAIPTPTRPSRIRNRLPPTSAAPTPQVVQHYAPPNCRRERYHPAAGAMGFESAVLCGRLNRGDGARAAAV